MRYSSWENVVLMSPRATQIKTYSWDNAQVVLVGNKLDLEEDRQVPTEDAQRLATELGQLTDTHTRTHIFLTQARLVRRTQTLLSNYS